MTPSIGYKIAALFKTVEVMMIDWNEAPKGARWWAMDANGQAHWFSTECSSLYGLLVLRPSAGTKFRL